jgi:zinc transport system substrate-binding protein
LPSVPRASLSRGRRRETGRGSGIPGTPRGLPGAWRSWAVLGGLVPALLLGGPAGGQDAKNGALHVVVSIPPQAGIVERVGDARVAVQVLVQPGQEPHTFEPTPRQIMDISAADLFLTIGLPFESRLVEKLRGSGSRLRFVDMAAGIERRKLLPGEGDAHSEPQGDQEQPGPGGEAHPDAHLDPHVWLAPAGIERLAENTARALQAFDPGGTSEYARNLEAFRGEIHAADARIRDLLAPFKGERFYVFHPAFGYFADAYGLRQVAAEAEGKEPAPRQLAEMIASARADGVRIIFVQPQFSTQAAAALASAIGGVVVPMDPLARDVLGNLEHVAREVHGALSH